MRISQLISKLQKIQLASGDLQVVGKFETEVCGIKNNEFTEGLYIRTRLFKKNYPDLKTGKQKKKEVLAIGPL